MMENERSDIGLIVLINMGGVILAYALLGISLWLSVDVPLATKGYWAMGIILLSISLINVVKYKFDQRIAQERLSKLQRYKDEKYLKDAMDGEE